MALRLIVIMSWFIIVIMILPQSWFSSSCTIKSCYYGSCTHAPLVFADSFWFPYAKAATKSVIAALHDMGDYKRANLVVYFGGVPAWALFNGWLHRQRWWNYAALIGSVGFMFLIAQYREPVGSMVEIATKIHPQFMWYYYCTEFCMRLANMTGLTYGGVCFFLFVVAIPGVLLVDFLWGVQMRLSISGAGNVPS